MAPFDGILNSNMIPCIGLSCMNIIKEPIKWKKTMIKDMMKNGAKKIQWISMDEQVVNALMKFLHKG